MYRFVRGPRNRGVLVLAALVVALVGVLVGAGRCHGR